MLGALHGADAFPPAMTAQVREVNGLDLAPLAAQLLALRRRAAL